LAFLPSSVTSGLRTQVQAAIDQHRLFRPRERILVAVSGGVDSMVLLHILHALTRKAGGRARAASARSWLLCVAHLNHALRGRSSDADERLVQRTAKTLGLPFVSERAHVKAFARESGISIEMAARQTRHEFLARAARKLHCRKIALAHHADDQVELFLLRLFRGSGLDGLGGMKWSNPSPVARGLFLARPLLGVRRDEIEAYARAERIRFRHDASNDSLDILRNRIRRELLPLLERRYQPAMRNVILRLMDLLAAESEFADAVTRTLLSAPSLAADRPKFDQLPIAAQRRLLQLQLLRMGLRHDYETVEGLRNDATRPITLAPGLAVRRDDSGAVQQIQTEPMAFNVRSKVVDLKGRGHTRFDGVAFQWQTKRHAVGRTVPVSRPNKALEVFDADRVGRRVILRHWEPGDRFQPIGMANSVKLQDFFANAKVPRARRHQLILATTEQGEILWVEGMRISERFKLDAATRRRLEWSWHRKADTLVRDAAGTARTRTRVSVLRPK
jgi:tRNA(Ile)-lysidine synthase